MVVLNRIYTRAGDAGETMLGDGSRVPKTSARVAAFGAVDEVNAALGLARLHADGDMAAAIERIQNDLFDLGADLCRPPAEGEETAEYPPLRITPDQTARLEAEIDAMNGDLAPLRSFILPGGSALSAYLHMARTTARRAERAGLELAVEAPVGTDALSYMNRLSDWLFVAARAANDNGARDILWTPGANR